MLVVDWITQRMCGFVWTHDLFVMELVILFLGSMKMVQTDTLKMQNVYSN